MYDILCLFLPSLKNVIRIVETFQLQIQYSLQMGRTDRTKKVNTSVRVVLYCMESYCQILLEHSEWLYCLKQNDEVQCALLNANVVTVLSVRVCVEPVMFHHKSSLHCIALFYIVNQEFYSAQWASTLFSKKHRFKFILTFYTYAICHCTNVSKWCC